MPAERPSTYGVQATAIASGQRAFANKGAVVEALALFGGQADAVRSGTVGSEPRRHPEAWGR